ncbi:MAG: hypothetical protein SGJ27_13430 [Candidatus Melainabacteria bacterium]|nr:hypothetical protein [Candidatus Melainabacteria bacterium]
MANANIGLYDVNLQLLKFDELPALEMEILKYCPDGPVARNAFDVFNKAAQIFTKRKKYLEANGALEAATIVLAKSDSSVSLTTVSIELMIGTTYLANQEFAKAKIWLEKARAHCAKVAPTHEYHIASIIRYGAACRSLGDNKTAILKYREAEKVAYKTDKTVRAVYLSHLYFNWAISYWRMGNFGEAEKKFKKALGTGAVETYPQLNAALAKMRADPRYTAGTHHKVAR